MTLVMVSWVLAMAAGLRWSRWWTGCFTCSTILLFVWTRAGVLGHWAGWLQLAILSATPWFLADQQRDDERVLAALHREEAVQMTHLSEATRSLLSLQATTQQTEAQLADITNVYHVTKATAWSLHLEELFASLLAIAPRLFAGQGLRLLDLSGERPQVFRAARGADGQQVADGKKNGTAGALEEAVLARVAANRRAEHATAAELACELPAGVTDVAWAPLWRKQQPIGVLIAEALPPAQLKLLAIVAHQLSLQLSRIHLYTKVEELAVTDALTGLYVRRHFLERAREELARSKRHGLACTLLMTDLDRFKEKNDTYGHLVGDLVLKDVAKLLQRNLREVDLIARYGGEEFIMLLIETPVEQALPIVQRLRQLVEVHPIRVYDELLSQTISIGMAGFPEDGQTLEALIERADQALYAAKRAGRNRTARWSPSLNPA